MSEAATPLAAADEPLVAPAAEPKTPVEGGDAPADITADATPADSTGEDKPAAADKPAETPEQAEARRVQERIQRGINKATRRYYAEKARADLLAQQLNEANSRVREPQQDNAAPRLEQFDYDADKYAKAYAAYETKKTLEQQRTQNQQAGQRAQIQALQTNWETRVAAAEAKYDDFDEVVGDLKPTTPWAVALMDADNGPDVAHYLGKNLDEAKRIMALPPSRQVLEIGRLSAKLEMTPSVPKTPSKAPAPISTVSGKSGGASDQPQDTDDINTWMKKENARMRKQASA